MWQQQIDSIIEKIPKMSGVFRDNCCESCRKILQKAPMKKSTEKYSLTDRCFYRTSAANSNN